MAEQGTDRWHRWLREGRFGADSAYRDKQLTEFLYPVRDRVLRKAQLHRGDTLLDVGCGDGLIAFAAFDLVGPSGRVIFCDISQDLLDHCRHAAAAEGLLDRCNLVQASANDLTGVADRSADVVTTRSVLIYVKDKAAALREFFRVLKPGGRASLCEPINVLMSGADPGRFLGYDVTPVRDLADKLEALYESIQPPGDPMTDFDERDLVRYAVDTGFSEINLELQLTVKTHMEPTPWDRFLHSSGNPLVPTFGEAMDQALSSLEAARLTGHLRPLVESGIGLERMALAYLTAAKS